MRLLDYLKRYTDKRNPASIPQIERYFASKGYPHFFGNKNTRKDMIKELVRALNTDINGNLLPYEKWRVVYDDFEKENKLGIPLQSHHIVNIYYNQEFDVFDIDVLLNSLNKNMELREDIKQMLINQVCEHLKNENFGKPFMTPAERTAEIRRKKRWELEMEYAYERKRRARELDW